MSKASELHQACKEGNTKRVKKLLRVKKRFFFLPSSSSTLFSTILSPDVPPDHTSGNAESIITPLVVAIRGGHLEVVKELLLRGANVKGARDTSPLAEAIIGGKLEIVKLLIKQGASITTKINNVRKTPLLMAMENGEIDIMKYLAIKGAILHEEEASKLLRSEKMNSTQMSWMLDNGGLEISSSLFYNIIENGSCELVEGLVMRGKANVNDILALEKAIEKRRKDMTELLIKLGVSVKRKERGSNVSLCGAVDNNWPDVVEKLLERGAEVNDTVSVAPEYVPMSPLFIAIQSGYYDTARILINHSASVCFIYLFILCYSFYSFLFSFLFGFRSLLASSLFSFRFFLLFFSFLSFPFLFFSFFSFVIVLIGNKTI